MFSHVTVGASDIDRAKTFFEAVLTPLGLVLRSHGPEWVGFCAPGKEFPFLSVLSPINDELPTAGNGSMIALLAPDRAAVDASYAAALRLAATCEGPPGLRPHYHEHYYGAYYRDPDGNKIHVVCHEAPA